MKYAISDVHGKFDKYESMLKLINFSDEDELFVIGDVIDRGPEGIKIIRDIMARQNVHMLMGNHEFMAIETLLAEDEESEWENLDLWEYNGGAKTLYDLLQLNEEECKNTVEFLANLPSSMDIETNGRKFHLVHGYPADSLKKKVWTRPELNTPNPLQDCTLIIGHTPVILFHGRTEWEMQKYIKKLHRKNEHFKIEHADGFIGIDCGCGTCYPEARLACLRLDDMEEFYV